MSKFYPIYYDNTIGFRVLDLEKDYDWGYVQDIEDAVLSYYITSENLDIDTMSGKVGKVNICEERFEPLIHFTAENK